MGTHKSGGEKGDRVLPEKRVYKESYVGKWLIKFRCGRRVFVSKANEAEARFQAGRMHADVGCKLKKDCIISYMEKKDPQ